MCLLWLAAAAVVVLKPLQAAVDILAEVVALEVYLRKLLVLLQAGHPIQ
jgi:hypothetical protein